MTQRHMNLKDMRGYKVRKLHRPRVSDALLPDTVDTTRVDYSLVLQHLCCSLHCAIS